MKKEERKIIAQKHHEEMLQKFANQIQEAINSSVLYGMPDKTPVRKAGDGSNQIFSNTDSVSAAIKFQNGNTTILNFADFTRPAGLFLKGSFAQEEALCHESFLCEVLTSGELSGYYKYNEKHKNNGLYQDRAIYTPNVIFERDKECEFNIITCASANLYSWHRYKRTHPEENDEVMKERIKFIRDIAEENKTNTLILGAFGCGVFEQNPKDIAKWFHDVFTDSSVKTVVYAVPGNSKNTKAFEEFFS